MDMPASTASIYPDLANTAYTTRSSIIENRHLIHVAVSTPTSLLYSVGDPQRITLIRSTAKPAQALAILTTPGVSETLSDEDVALVCASHSAEPAHVDRARAILARAGVPEAELSCGGHASISDDVNASWAEDGVKPTGIHNNCSGKHAGMLAANKQLGGAPKGYELADSPIGVRVRNAVGSLVGECQWGLDGCNLPAPAMELQRLARMYAMFAAAKDRDEGGEDDDDGDSDQTVNGTSSPYTATMARIFTAMSTHPHLVGGKGRFCTELMASVPGVIGKVGADGVYGVGLRSGVCDEDGPVGIAVKVEDGNRRILYAVVCEVLARLGAGSDEERALVDEFKLGREVNSAGVEVGRIEMPFKLRVH